MLHLLKMRWHEIFLTIGMLNSVSGMKKMFLIYIAVMLFTSCGNSGKDAVEKADSANAALRDSMPKGLIPADKQTSSFLVQAGDVSYTQVQLSELAFQKGLNQELKSLGSKLMRDHVIMNETIKKLAETLQVTVPLTPGEANQRKIDDLKAKDTKNFDKDLTTVMINLHQNEVNLFDKASKAVNNADVKSFIDSGLPQLRLHLDSLKLIEKILK